MDFLALRSSRFGLCAFGAAAVGLAGTSVDAAIMIEFTGMNLVYDGSSLFDAGSTAGGLADPADADPLISVDFLVDGGLVGSLSSDISVDVFIPDVTNIPAGANVVHNLITPGNPGFFDLLIGTSPLASEFLLLDIESVNITYTDIAGVVQFVFGATIASAFSQNLPFGLVAADPVTLSFSAQVDPGSITDDGEFITGFEAFGTGEYRAVPAPSALVVMCVPAFAIMRRRR